MGAEEAGAPAGSALRSPLLSPQRCLIQVAFRPVLPSELVHREASQALSRPAEAKVVRAGLQEEGRGGHGGGRDFLHPPPRDSRGEGVPRTHAELCSPPRTTAAHGCPGDAQGRGTLLQHLAHAGKRSPSCSEAWGGQAPGRGPWSQANLRLLPVSLLGKYTRGSRPGPGGGVSGHPAAAVLSRPEVVLGSLSAPSPRPCGPCTGQSAQARAGGQQAMGRPGCPLG